MRRCFYIFTFSNKELYIYSDFRYEIFTPDLFWLEIDYEPHVVSVSKYFSSLFFFPYRIIASVIDVSCAVNVIRCFSLYVSRSVFCKV